MDTKKISVLTPSYNSGKYIERAIQNVLSQDYQNWEHIIVDGQSKDETINILKKYPHLKWISEPDQGQSDAMNKAFQMCTGDIIVYLNADDWFEDNIFLHVCSEFDRNQNVDMLVGNLIVYFEGKKKELRKPSIVYEDILSYWKTLFPGNPVSYFYKRELQSKIGQFPINYHYTMDYWFLLKAYQIGKVGYLDETFGTFYIDGFNKTATSFVLQNLHITLLKHLALRDPLNIFNIYKKYISFFGFRRTIEYQQFFWYVRRIMQLAGLKRK
ncbi:glycosyltransferase involved in cell wall biosynthesis [Catalinimonas alkaloidigena]|uniref:glycosyltransferase family 2 protein n=1 Tax=Catalinimonas alkaloidigena TaxID=1075417 RepID=UPI0024073F93|nr:glycosyltransferase family 2 protein [Catalinimonas alkaloidigena]MDF9795215.1 glycosyltransferase involved in cell wall biosynthesis [Catalinimonas alkaloidigena]